MYQQLLWSSSASIFFFVMFIQMYFFVMYFCNVCLCIWFRQIHPATLASYAIQLHTEAGVLIG